MNNLSWNMVAALVSIAAVVVGKVLTMRLLDFNKHRIDNVKHIKRELLKDLKLVQHQAKVLAANKSTLKARKLKLEGQLSRLHRELTAAQEEVEQAERAKLARQGRLMREAGVG